MRKLTSREKTLLLAGAVFALAAGLFWEPLTRGVLMRLLLWSDAPSAEVVSELVSKSERADSFLTRLWHTDKIPHRLLVMDSIKRHFRQRPLLYDKLLPVLASAARDADLEVRSAALEILAAQSHSDLPRWALEQLQDADPAVRVLGLRILRKTGDPRLVPALIPLLEDHDPRVIASADLVLRAWTGQDFGIRLADAGPEFIGPRAANPKSADPERLAKGIQDWKNWWSLHSKDYPAWGAGSKPGPSASRLPAPEFSLEALDGSRIRLADHRGRSVLLFFWDTKTQECLDQLRVLTKVQKQHLNNLAILGISLDATASEREHKCEHGPAGLGNPPDTKAPEQGHKCEHGNAHSGGSSAKAGLAHVRCELRDTIERIGINFQVLIDRDGSAGRLYGSDTLPTCVLIDPDGVIRRRFIGGRDTAAWETIISEMGGVQIKSHPH